MPRQNKYSPKEISQMLSLYADNIPIKEILKRTGIKSEQTFYAILDKHEIKRRKKSCPIKKTISFESDIASDILEHSDNTSAFVCECIRKAKKYDELMKELPPM